MTVTMAKDDRIQLRTTSEQKQILEAAAELTGTSVTGFILHAAVSQAQEALLDQRVFVLEPEKFDAFLSEVTNAPDARERIEKLLSIPKPWAKW
ncbi:MAG: DUF1778 domain-containing protein [Aquiluna sp.]|nr:DUF1778 domain-containing protein [Aquiluna sp.]MCF8545628.1 DUF1778 domain-containing protein [Aquiluna sp.]